LDYSGIFAVTNLPEAVRAKAPMPRSWGPLKPRKTKGTIITNSDKIINQQPRTLIMGSQKKATGSIFLNFNAFVCDNFNTN
jgi:hypothetical protein